MKTNVIYLNQEYSVNPDKQAVHCRLTYAINLDMIPGIDVLVSSPEFDDYMEYLTNKYDGVSTFYENNITVTHYDGSSTTHETNHGFLVFESTGLCKCAPQDNFDADLGKKIASTRAQEMAFKDTKVFYEDLANMVMGMFGDLFSLIENCENSAKKCKKHSHDLTGHTPVEY